MKDMSFTTNDEFVEYICADEKKQVGKQLPGDSLVQHHRMRHIRQSAIHPGNIFHRTLFRIDVAEWVAV